MQAQELLTDDVPLLTPEDKLFKAVDIFLDRCICHIPIVKDGILEGILPVDFLMDTIDKDVSISDFRSDWINAFAFSGQHGLDVFEIISRYELTALPVVDENKQYIGTIITQTLMSRLSGYYSFRQIGGIIVLNVGARDYDLSEISRIVESNGAKILILYMDTDEENGQFKVTIKVNTLDLSHILATFERFKYTIDYYHPSGMQRDELQERYGLLMKLFDL
jgi:predicted transcriptional regulator